MLASGAAYPIMYYRTFLGITQFRQPITVVRCEQKTKTYTGDIVPMIERTTLSFNLDADGEHQFQLQTWITETKTSILLAIDFCRLYVSKVHFEVPAIELKKNAQSYFLWFFWKLVSYKTLAFFSIKHTIRTPHEIFNVAKTSGV